MRRIGHHHIGLGHRFHHAALRYFALQLANAAAYFGFAFGVFHFVAHFLMGHAHLFVVIPDLERHIHRRN